MYNRTLYVDNVTISRGQWALTDLALLVDDWFAEAVDVLDVGAHRDVRVGTECVLVLLPRRSVNHQSKHERYITATYIF